MIDAISVVGLAGNIAQFIAYGFKLLGNASEIRKSADGAMKDHLNIELIAGDLNSMLSRIKLLDKSKCPQLKSLQDACVEVINDLLQTIKTIKPKENGSKWESIRAAMKASRKEEKIKAWMTRLRDFRDQFNQHVEVYIL
jgi:hypothetical protein